MSAGPPQQPPIDIAYETPPRRSRSALAALALGIFALVPLMGIPFAVAAIVFAAIALRHIRRPPHNTTGKGFAFAAIICALLGLTVSPIYFVMIARAHERANQSYCAANLRGIAQSLIIYNSESNIVFPCISYAPCSPTNAGTFATLGTTDPETTMGSLYLSTAPQRGSPLAGAWLLVLRNQASTNQFLCKSDPAASSRALVTDGTGRYFTNFQADSQISYSFAYPYLPNGNIGQWWFDSRNPSVPVAADMAPRNGTGSPIRNLVPGSLPVNPKSWNSANHGGVGQNVAFADGHTEFTSRPDVGQSGDNIFTTTDRNAVSQFGGTQPYHAPVSIQTENAPFDTFMLPARDLDTGRL